jgi:polyhydroxyalkanoate synthase
MTDPSPDELANRAAPLDALLIDAALGPMRRLTPNSSTVRFAMQTLIVGRDITGVGAFA